MIGKSVSNAVLDGWTGAFYQWEGDVKVKPAWLPALAWLRASPLPGRCLASKRPPSRCRRALNMPADLARQQSRAATICSRLDGCGLGWSHSAPIPSVVASRACPHGSAASPAGSLDLRQQARSVYLSADPTCKAAPRSCLRLPLPPPLLTGLHAAPGASAAGAAGRRARHHQRHCGWLDSGGAGGVPGGDPGHVCVGRQAGGPHHGERGSLSWRAPLLRRAGVACGPPLRRRPRRPSRSMCPPAAVGRPSPLSLHSATCWAVACVSSRETCSP